MGSQLSITKFSVNTFFLTALIFSGLVVFKKITYMEFKKTVMITLYVKQKKRRRCTEQTFGLCGRRRGWDVLKEQHVYYL